MLGAKPQTIILYVASSNDKLLMDSSQDTAKGIYIYQLDQNSGKMTLIDTVDAIVSSQFLTVAPGGKILYATEFVRDLPEGQGSYVHAFTIDPKAGQLTHINQQPGKGDSPCYVTTDRNGQSVLSVNYRGVDDRGSVCVFPVQGDGSIGNMINYLQHDGSSVNQNRQTCSHPHMITTDPSNEWVLVPDLGIDKIMVYRLAQGRLTPTVTSSITTNPGAGPRHLAFHPEHPYLYIIHELENTITAYHYQADSFERLETVTTLPDGYEGISSGADIHVHPSGRFLYGSNRGHNSIVAYAIDAVTGRLEYISHCVTQGDWPRSFAIDARGKLLIVANQHSA